MLSRASTSPRSATQVGPAARQRDILRQAGLRVTRVRLGVVDALANSRTALDAQAVLQRLGGAAADRVTVYRTLNALAEAGVAHRVDAGDRKFRYGLTSHEHCTPGHHDHEHPHLVCDRCGRVECMDDAEVLVRPRGRGGRSRAAAWSVKRQSVTVHGVCGPCGKAKAPAGTARRERPPA